MSIFKKKLLEGGTSSFDLPELPSFPEVQEIKDALKPRESTSEVIPPLPMLPSILHSSQPPESQWQKQETNKGENESSWEEPRAQVVQEPARPMPIYEDTEERTEPRQKEPIFIKIDKFSDALSNFESIKKKVEEIDNLLKKTREIRQREKDELDAWEKEIIEIKDRMRIIDEKLFSKLG